MKLPFLAIILGNALLASSGTILMRHGGKNLDWSQGVVGILSTGKLWLTGMAMCWVAGLVFALLLTKNELLTSFIIYLVLNFIFIGLGGHFLLGEHLSPAKYLGAILSLVGICLLL